MTFTELQRAIADEARAGRQGAPVGLEGVRAFCGSLFVESNWMCVDQAMTNLIRPFSFVLNGSTDDTRTPATARTSGRGARGARRRDHIYK